MRPTVSTTQYGDWSELFLLLPRPDEVRNSTIKNLELDVFWRFVTITVSCCVRAAWMRCEYNKTTFKHWKMKYMWSTVASLYLVHSSDMHGKWPIQYFEISSISALHLPAPHLLLWPPSIEERAKEVQDQLTFVKMTAIGARRDCNNLDAYCWANQNCGTDGATLNEAKRLRFPMSMRISVAPTVAVEQLVDRVTLHIVSRLSVFRSFPVVNYLGKNRSLSHGAG